MSRPTSAGQNRRKAKAEKQNRRKAKAEKQNSTRDS